MIADGRTIFYWAAPVKRDRREEFFTRLPRGRRRTFAEMGVVMEFEPKISKGSASAT
jgi:hypothetical protein